MGAEITSAEAGINTLEDLMNLGTVGYSRSDPTLWSTNQGQIRIDPKLYQARADMSQAWHYSEIYQKYGIKESGQYYDEWKKDYLKNYNAGTLPPHPQGSSGVGGQTSYLWVLPGGGQVTTPDLTPPPELQGTYWQNGGYKPPQTSITPPEVTPTPTVETPTQQPTTGQPTGVMKPPSTGFGIGSPTYQLWKGALGDISLPSSIFAQNRFSGMTTGWDNPYYKNLFKPKLGTQRR